MQTEVKRRTGRVRLAGVLAAAALAAATVTGSALGVVGGSPDNSGHPYVAAILYFTGHGFELCSGSLVTPTVLVTAAHCAPDGATVSVSFDPNAIYTNPFTWPTGTFHADPSWRVGAAPGLPGFDTHDLAVVVLDQPAAGVSRLAQVPGPGYADTLPNNQLVDIVGYGLQDAQVGPMAPLHFGVREVGEAKIIPGGGRLGAEFLKISSSNAAICQGDSGGPNLQAGTDTILSTSTFGPNTTCKAVAYSERLDTPDAQAFLHGYGVPTG